MSNDKKLKSSDWLVLTSDEEVIHSTHPSIWPILQQVAFGVVIGIIGVALALQIHIGGLVLTLFGLLFGAYAEIDRRYRWYVLTTEQIWKKRGILRQNTVQSRYDDVENIELNKGIVERLLNFGDIRVLTSGTSSSEFRIENVPNPKKFKSLAIEQVDIVHERGYYQTREEAEEVGGGSANAGRQEPNRVGSPGTAEPQNPHDQTRTEEQRSEERATERDDEPNQDAAEEDSEDGDDETDGMPRPK